MEQLTRHVSAGPPVSLETAVMDRIFKEQTIQLRRLKMRRRIRILGISGATACRDRRYFLCPAVFGLRSPR